MRIQISLAVHADGNHVSLHKAHKNALVQIPMNPSLPALSDTKFIQESKLVQSLVLSKRGEMVSTCICLSPSRFLSHTSCSGVTSKGFGSTDSEVKRRHSSEFSDTLNNKHRSINLFLLITVFFLVLCTLFTSCSCVKGLQKLVLAEVQVESRDKSVTKGEESRQEGGEELINKKKCLEINSPVSCK